MSSKTSHDQGGAFVLAFSEEAIAGDIERSGWDAERLVAHADQREGERPPGGHLTILHPKGGEALSPTALHDRLGRVNALRGWCVYRLAPGQAANPVVGEHVFLALTNPVEGRRAEFERWYDQEHVPDILAVEGFVSGERIWLDEEESGGYPAQWSHLALYRMVGSVHEAHQRLERADHITMTDALDPDHVAWVYTHAE